MSTNITELVKQYEEKAKALKKQMKNPNSYVSTFSNTVDFRDKNLHFANQGGTITSRYDKLENYFFKGYPYKRGVKQVIDPEYEPHVAVGGEDDLYGICIDIDEFTSTATVLPITEEFTGYLVAKQNSGIKRKDKLKFDSNGELEKSSSNSKINAVALSDAIELDSEKKLCMVHVAIYGNKGKPS
ncbi:DUF228 domain-containing protein (plasmid) [Borrelia miyamotoi]|uniref:DUF228 domain-containing protein n=2 Tax=Borrelia miyamotoi TaxID=47466 RepID=A0A481YF10_9SPIR|nr:DUF228 domain-containing protein [Borrelia miyamotoi]MBW6186332.1 DUF228 domain-containing protein [Pseudomonas aeruginosa]AHH05702.1 Hypothetical protein BOM_1159 [Borrelia miyamotoi FR64b]ATQ19150.1 DUF228 domain-containing protein [Borrelia miyamotoi]QBK62581.1 DUF228 domain-containing protein [Borrelia miyamotoi]QBK63997.1 DUF228 domain-containing protein [Borrelia miyamotoi]